MAEHLLSSGEKYVGSTLSTTTNKKGQVTNTARATGTDKKHKDDVKSSISAHGMSTQQQPPYIFDDGEQLDGFTRGEAVTELGFDEWVFNIAVPKLGSLYKTCGMRLV